MGNGLNELQDPISQGRDINVINKQLPVKVGVGSTIFVILLWVLGVIPGVIFLFRSIAAKNYFKQLEQRLQKDASQIDNFMEQRVMILQNAASLLKTAMNFEEGTLTKIAQYRGGVNPDSDTARNEQINNIEHVSRQINVAIEAYPNLESIKVVRDAMQQNSYLQKEITAAREVYNDTIMRWNNDVNIWPVKQIVAAKAKYTTRIPFATTQEIKQQARGNFFN